MKSAVLLLPLALSGCITFRTIDDGIGRARIGETAHVAGHTIMPLKVVEDSRCPVGTQCVWAGRVRITALVDGSETELTTGASEGAVRLVEVYPQRRANTTYYPDEYRFGFTTAR